MDRTKTMSYNTERTKMYVEEYGRHIHVLVEKLCEIENDELRLEAAYKTVNVLKLVNQQYKTSENSDQKIWDMLYYISNFKLNVNGPYPPPPKDNFIFQPLKMGYNSRLPKKSNHLGKNLLSFIKIAMDSPSPEEQQYMTKLIAHYMRLSYITWHNEMPNDHSIKAEISELSGGQLTYEVDGASVNQKYYSLVKPQTTAPPTNYRHNKKPQQQNRKRR